MGKTNTEKPTGMKEQKRQVVQTPKKQEKVSVPVKNEEKKEEIKKEEIKETKTVEEKPKTEKKVVVKKVKKDEVVVNSYSVPISTKYSVAICKFIKNKKIEKAIEDLEQVQQLKKPVPMKGEIPHRKGKIMSGRFPKTAAEKFVKILKCLKGNADNHDVEDPIITEAIANQASRPVGRFGRWERKRTHVKIKATARDKIKKKKQGEKK